VTDEGVRPVAGAPSDAAVIRFGAAVIEVVLEHARTSLPHECCGLLLGSEDVVRVAWPARNELASPNRYRVDARDYLAAARFGRKHGLDVVGAYHSHPTTAAIPSATDLAESAGEHFVYLIAGDVGQPPARHVRAYRFGDGNFLELRVVAVPQESL
jgi:proteasome lid subunit RPN8/RPN11